MNHPCNLTAFHPAGTFNRVWPHSMQDVLRRGVINPQKGHILWDAKSLLGFSRPNNVPSKSVTMTRSLRSPVC